MSAIVEITDATFVSEVVESKLPTLVDYWADWCTPCKQIAPILEELAKTYSSKIKFCKLDTNSNPGTAQRQGVMALPTIQIFQNGRVVESLQGGKTKSALVKVLEKYV